MRVYIVAAALALGVCAPAGASGEATPTPTPGPAATIVMSDDARVPCPDGGYCTPSEAFRKLTDRVEELEAELRTQQAEFQAQQRKSAFAEQLREREEREPLLGPLEYHCRTVGSTTNCAPDYKPPTWEDTVSGVDGF